VRLWRVSLPQRAAQILSGEGPRLFGGRWNRPGQPAVYCASTASLAVLEWLANVDPADAPEQLVAVAYELPDDEPVTAYKLTDLPAGWRRYPVPTAVQGIGGDWLDAGAAAALIVPSAVLPIAGEHNFVLNPAHPGFERLRQISEARIEVDPRLLR
jgi:RES domain-containing protein